MIFSGYYHNNSGSVRRQKKIWEIIHGNDYVRIGALRLKRSKCLDVENVCSNVLFLKFCFSYAESYALQLVNSFPSRPLDAGCAGKKTHLIYSDHERVN